MLRQRDAVFGGLGRGSLALAGTALVAGLLAPLTNAKSTRVLSLAEIRYESVVPQEWDTSCGAAALATLLTYDLLDPVSEREVATAMLHRTDPIRVRTRGGFSLLNMQEYADTRGYQADGYGELAIDDLVTMLPAIVPVEFHGYDHFIVVRRIAQNQVFFADPAYGRRTISVKAFEQSWNSKIAFVIGHR